MTSKQNTRVQLGAERKERITENLNISIWYSNDQFLAINSFFTNQNLKSYLQRKKW